MPLPRSRGLRDLASLALSPADLLKSGRRYFHRNRSTQTHAVTPRPGYPPAAAASLVRVLTYNIHHGVWTNGRTNLRPLRELAARFDVVCLNEASRTQARCVASLLGFHWVSTDTSEAGRNPYSNNAILSRYPIAESRVHLLPYFFLIPWRRRLLQALLDVGGRPVHVLAAHVSFLPGERARHLRCAGEVFSRLSGPKVLCGDLNSGPRHREVQQISTSYRDAWAHRGCGPGLTFGTRRPWRRMDYIFLSSHLSVLDVEMPQTRQPDGSFPSDHHPVGATLSL